MTKEKNNLGAPAKVEAIMGGKAIEMENNIQMQEAK